MPITLKFGSDVPSDTQKAATTIVNAINASGIFPGNKTIVISNFSKTQLATMGARTGNTNGDNNSQIQVNQTFDYVAFNKGPAYPVVSLSGSILHEITHALYPGVAGSNNDLHAAPFYIDELTLANAIGMRVDYSDVGKAEQALQRDQGFSLSDARKAIAKFPSSGIQPNGTLTESPINYMNENNGVDPTYIQNAVLSGNGLAPSSVDSTGTVTLGPTQIDGYAPPGGDGMQTPAQLNVGGSYLTFAGAPSSAQDGAAVSAPADQLAPIGAPAADPLAFTTDPSNSDVTASYQLDQLGNSDYFAASPYGGGSYGGGSYNVASGYGGGSYGYGGGSYGGGGSFAPTRSTAELSTASTRRETRR